MKTERIIWGLVFLFIGGILLLNNFNVINFHWETVWRMWPLVLIVIGANMLFARGNGARAGVLSVIITLAALAFIAYHGAQRPGYQAERSADWGTEDDNNDDDNLREADSTFVEQLNPGVTRAELNISGGATSYKLQDTTSDLFAAQVSAGFGNYSLFRISKDSADVLNFKMNGKKRWSNRSDARSNEARIKLSTKPVWDLNLEVGAGKIDFDLSPYKLRSFRFEGGAASLDLKLGQPMATTTVSAETGASKVKISIPKNVACQIKVDSGLSSNDFDGFTKRDENTYQTDNFDDARNKLVINLEGGLSKFEVKRY